MRASIVAILLSLLLIPAATAHAQSYAVVRSDGSQTHVPDFINASGVIGSTVATEEAFSATPTLGQLQAYDSVLVYTNNAPQDPVLLGNVLADYVDGGGGVVLVGGANFANFGVTGRLSTGGYFPIPEGAYAGTTPGATTTFTQPSHPIFAGVTSFTGGSNPFIVSGTTAPNGSTTIATWATGDVAVAVNTSFAGRVVGINTFAYNSNLTTIGWDAATDGDVMFANALVWAGEKLALSTNTGLTVDEGGSATVLQTELEAVDTTVMANGITFTISTLPAVCSVQLSGTTLAVNDTFTQADVNNGLVSIVNDGSEQAADTFDVAIDNGTNTINETISITVNPTNDAPTLTVPSMPQVTGLEIALTFGSGSGNAIEVADPDAASGMMEVTMSATNGTMTLAATTGVTFAAGSDNSASMTLQGTLTDLNAAMNGMTYTPGPGYIGADSLQVDVSDLGNTGAGMALTDSGTVAIDVLPLYEIGLERDATPIATAATDDLTALAPNTTVLLMGEMITVTYTITSSGFTTLEITDDITVEEGFGINVEVTTQPSTSVTTGTTTTFEIQIVPYANGLGTATITIPSNDPDENPYTFDISIPTGGFPVEGDCSMNTTGTNMTWFWLIGLIGLPLIIRRAIS